MGADVLYVTFDGVLQPLAFSQVVRVLAGLAKRGLRYHLLSLERSGDLEKADVRRAVDEILAPVGVKWTPLAAASMSTASLAAKALTRMSLEATRIVKREGIRLVHARGYQSALVALMLKRVRGVPYVFDARGYWIEERSGPEEWFSTAASYAMGKLVEQTIFRQADAVVTLTALQATDVESGIFGKPPRHLEVIPTCADYEAFYLRDSRPGQPDGASSVPFASRSRLAGKNVVAIVGALNGTYFVKETLMLAKLVAELNPAAHLLVLSAKQREYQSAIGEVGIPPERYTIAFAEHSSMPDWLQWIDWGLLLIPETEANRAKMPTKLAEFFATGVRPVFFGCNSDAQRWVQRAGSGLLLRSVRAEDLQTAALAIASSATESVRLRSARDITASHFSLARGVDRYDRLISACLERAGRSDHPDPRPPEASVPQA